MKNFNDIIQNSSENDNSLINLRINLDKVDELIQDKKILKKGVIYFAPPKYHLLIDNTFCIMLSDDEKVNFSKPSIDVLFKSAAIAFRNSLIGVILTGANNDGAVGLKYIKQLGGYTIVQNPQKAYIKTMPQMAIDKCNPDVIADLDKIALILSELDKL